MVITKNFKIYLDCCCFNRPFDDLSVDKIRFECEAVTAILQNAEKGFWDIYRSDVLDEEINRITNTLRKLKVLNAQRILNLLTRFI